MRYQGKIIDWKDDQGFGFVIPNGGGQKAFVHIKAFSKISHRPADGDIITYEIATDGKERYFAKNIRFAGETSSNTPNKLSSLSVYFTITFCIFLALSVVLGLLPYAIGVLYLTLSIVTFFMYAKDKSAARNESWRIKEKTLHLLGLIGGWPGALLAQKTFRHKSKKQEFQNTFWVTVVANIFILSWLLLTKNGADSLRWVLSYIAQ